MKKSYANILGRKWYDDVLEHLENFPVSFIYNQKKYDGFSADHFVLISNERHNEKNKETANIVFQLEKQVEITLITAFYLEYGVAEWTVWFENIGTTDSGILEQVESCLTFRGERPVLKGILGDHVNQYHPYSIELTDMPAHFCADDGRPTHINFPYFNLEYGDCGVMLAIGWGGTWSANFVCDGDVTTYRAKSTHNLKTYLKPGEKIRTALFVRAPYQIRNESYATNYWRSWIVNCNLPPYDATGKALEPFSACCLASDTGIPNSDGSITESFTTWRPSLEKMIAEDVKVDFRWFDAGWYIAPDGTSPENDWCFTVGTWELDPVKWPGKTFLESTEFARENGMKTLMWFEPKRVADVDSLVKNYGYKKEWAIPRKGVMRIANNIGNSECYEWTKERILKTLRENKVEMYREDHNSAPGNFWNCQDLLEGENRKGITECKFVINHYKMWDEIIACTLSYGGCGFIDSCAAGGGRNDLESLRRGVPLLRSDSDRTTSSLRLSMTTAFNRWIPFCGANTKEKVRAQDATGQSDVYIWRASYLPCLNVDSQFVYDPVQNFDMLRFGLREWKKVSPYLLKDFYVHTPWHSEEDKSGFTAYSFFDEEQDKGVLFLFRMEDCNLDNLNIKLPYAEDGKTYTFADEDSGAKCTFKGSVLNRTGENFTVPERRTARLIWIEGEEKSC